MTDDKKGLFFASKKSKTTIKTPAQKSHHPAVKKPGEESPLLTLYRKWLQRENKPQQIFSRSDLLEDSDAENANQLPYWFYLERCAEQILRNLAKNPPEPVPPKIELLFSQDLSQCWCFVFPPFHSEDTLTLSRLQEEIQNRGINTGLKEDRINQLVAEQQYMKLVKIAQGSPAQNGRDGSIEFLIKIPDKARLFQVDESAGEQVDFRNLDWLVSVKAGDPLCNIIPPAEGADGISIKGTHIAWKPGKAVAIPMGKNTEVSEDGSQLISLIDGTVFLRSQKLVVEDTVTIEKDVDYSTGNLRVDGNILIKGTIRNGFTVEATGDIVVRQRVENAIVKAGGDIKINYGMNGNFKGTLWAGGNIRCKYLENSHVFAHGNVLLGSAVNSKVQSDGEVLITLNPGVVIGGSISSAKKITAISAGSKSRYILTDLAIRQTPEFLEKKRHLAEALKQEQNKLEIIDSTISKLGEIPPEKQVIMDQLIEQQNALRSIIAKSKEELQLFQKKEDEITSGQILLNVVYHGTQLTIGKATKTIEDTAHSCLIMNKDGEIYIGLK